MEKVFTAATVKIQDNAGFVYRIAKIEYEEFGDGQFRYSLIPTYGLIELLPEGLYPGFSGINTAAREVEYVMQNFTPMYIEERIPAKVSELGRLNRLEWLMENKSLKEGDRLYFEKYDSELDNPKMVDFDEIIASEKRSLGSFNKLIAAICYGNYIMKDNHMLVDDNNRAAMLSAFMALYSKEKEHVASSQNSGAAKGRRRITVDKEKMDEVIHWFMTNQIGEKEACDLLGMSRSSLYRRMRELDLPYKRSVKE